MLLTPGMIGLACVHGHPHLGKFTHLLSPSLHALSLFPFLYSLRNVSSPLLDWCLNPVQIKSLLHPTLVKDAVTCVAMFLSQPPGTIGPH